MSTPPAVDAFYDADQLSSAELDALPYGMIQLDARGVILRYSQAETRLSGLTADECVGRHFFDEVAPCTYVREFYGRFRDGVAAQQLDAVFNFRFAFVPPREVRVHMFYSRVTRSVIQQSLNCPPAWRDSVNVYATRAPSAAVTTTRCVAWSPSTLSAPRTARRCPSSGR